MAKFTILASIVFGKNSNISVLVLKMSRLYDQGCNEAASKLHIRLFHRGATISPHVFSFLEDSEPGGDLEMVQLTLISTGAMSVSQ